MSRLKDKYMNASKQFPASYQETQVPAQVVPDALSLFDEQFSIKDLQKAISRDERSADSIMTSIRKAVKEAAGRASEEEQEPRYIVDFDEATKQKLAAGEIKLDTRSTGEIYAQLRDQNGHYGKKLPIKEELLEQDVSMEDVELVLQMDVIRDQLKDIISALSSIEGQITEVIRGQQNDRLGLFYSGLSLYMEARVIGDEALKKQITAQALKSLSDANAQMIQEIRTSVEYLANEEYRHSRRSLEKIDEHLSIIHQCYDIVYRAAFLKAAIYHENKEIPAMLAAIDEYGRFVDKMVVPVAGKLTELDRESQFIEAGTWGKICNTLKGCRELKEQITKKHTYYITAEEV